MKKGSLFLIMSLALFCFLGIYSFRLLAKDLSHEMSPTCYLVFSPHAKLEMDPQKPEQGKLVLENVDATVNGFSLSPGVQGSKISMERLLTYWDATPAVSRMPPTSDAGLIYYDTASKQTREIKVNLNTPKYDVGKKWLSFDVTCAQEHCLPSQVFDQLVLYLQEP